MQHESFDEAISFTGLFQAWRKAKRGASGSSSSLAFEYNLESELLRLSDELASGYWQPGGYRTFIIHEPKKRLIAEAPFRDRVVHHALVGLLEPYYEERFIENSFATRKGKGTHKAVLCAQENLRQHQWYLKSDIQSYFASVKLPLLIKLLQDDGHDPRLLTFVERILFCDCTMPGLPIGNLTSQFLANVYLDAFDKWVLTDCAVPGYLRYMDDFVLFHEDKEILKKLQMWIKDWLLDNRGLLLKARATRINKRSHGLGFLGTRVFPGTIRLRRENLKRTLRHLAKREWEAATGRISQDELATRAGSHLAHVEFWNTHHLKERIFFGRSSRAARTACFGAAAGTTTTTTSSPPIATTTTRTTRTTTTVSVSPAPIVV